MKEAGWLARQPLSQGQLPWLEIPATQLLAFMHNALLLHVPRVHTGQCNKTSCQIQTQFMFSLSQFYGEMLFYSDMTENSQIK